MLDNLNAHKSPTVRQLIEARGATCFLSPYSHDYNPIRARVGTHPTRIRKHGPRTAGALGRIGCAARHVYIRVTVNKRPRLCRDIAVATPNLMRNDYQHR